MSISSIGDLATSMQMRRDTARVKENLTRLTSELSSGVTSDVAGRLNGDFGYLSGIEQSLVRMDSYRSVIEEHRLVIASQQLTLEKLRDFGSISTTFLSLPEAADSTLINNAGSEALANFSSALASLNTQIGGRTVFSGIGTNQPAVADSETVLNALELDIVASGAVTADDVATLVTGWYSIGGGYDTIGYIGDAPSTTSIRLADNEVASPPINAEEGAIRNHLAALAMGALLGRNVLGGNLVEQGNLARISGESLLASNDEVIGLQASLGSVEAQIERASVEVASQNDALEIARAGLIEVDPYDAATELQNAEGQLQTIYAITARLSRLSLAEYL